MSTYTTRYVLAGWLMAVFFTPGFSLLAQPKPGDVFQEFVFPMKGRSISEIDPSSSRMKDSTFRMFTKPIRVVHPINVDLTGATRAEMSVEYWGGHIGTSEQKFSVNQSDWIYFTQPSGMKGSPNCYHRTLLGYDAVPIPLESLKNGRNEIVFTAGPQTCYNFNWGFYWVYSFTVRVYYSSDMPHPEARLVSVQPGDTLTELPYLTAEITRAPNPIRQVDFIGYYKDFDWEGNGSFEQWHYVTDRGRIMRHIGTAAGPPYQVRWNTDWLPDQDKPIKLAVKVTDEKGISSISSAVENVAFVHPDWSIKMYTSEDVPERFSARAGGSSKSSINVPGSLEHARTARLVLSSWSAKTEDGLSHGIRINGHKLADNFGRFHDHSFDEINVPLEWIVPGQNVISIHSDFMGHALEINWPGPVLLIAYANPSNSSTH